MRHVACGVLVGAVVAVTAMPARAQESGTEASVAALTTGEEQDLTKKAGEVVPVSGVRKIVLSGGVSLEGVVRDDFFDGVFRRSGAPSPRDESFINARFNLNVNIDVSDALAGYFELGTGPDTYGFESRRVGDNNQFARFRQGWVQIHSSAAGINPDDFDAWLRLGIQEVKVENRRMGAQGHPFLIDLLNSENPFTGTTNLALTASGVYPIVGPFVASRNTFLGGNAWWYNVGAGTGGLGGQPSSSEAGGARAVFRVAKDSLNTFNVDFDLGGFTTLETGLAKADTQVGFATLDIYFGKGNENRQLKGHHSMFSLIGMGIGGNGAAIASGGAALDAFFFDNLLEIFGEGHFQGGAYMKAPNPTGSDFTRQESFGAYGGIRFQAPWTQVRPYFEVSYWYLSGDDGLVANVTTGRLEANKDFISFENVNQALILESSSGLDIDANYTAFKVQTGLTLWDQVEFNLFVGVFGLAEEPHASLLPTVPVVVTSVSNKLGTEIDARITWSPSTTVRLSLVVGALTGADFFEDMGRTTDNSALAASFTTSVIF